MENIKKKLEKAGYKVSFKQDLLDDRHEHHLWYSGAIVSLVKDEIEVTIGARGRVKCALYQDGCEVASVDDMRYEGLFYKEMSDYILDDGDLLAYMNGFDNEFTLKDDHVNYFDVEAIDLRSGNPIVVEDLLFGEWSIHEILLVDKIDELFDVFESEREIPNINTLDSYADEGFKIERNGEIIILTDDEVGRLLRLDKALSGRNFINAYLETTELSDRDRNILNIVAKNESFCAEFYDNLFGDTEQLYDKISGIIKV